MSIDQLLANHIGPFRQKSDTDIVLSLHLKTIVMLFLRAMKYTYTQETKRRVFLSVYTQDKLYSLLGSP